MVLTDDSKMTKTNLSFVLKGRKMPKRKQAKALGSDHSFAIAHKF